MPSIQSAQAWYHATDPVHGFDHVLRVYRLAERIALAEGADFEIVQAAVLLHDAGGYPSASSSGPDNEDNDRGEQSVPPRENHHYSSADFARQQLLSEGWPEERIEQVVHAIRAHRFRDQREQPQSLEAKVLFDADKLDAIGAIGVARAVAYAARDGQPAYAAPSAGFIQTGELEPGEPHSSYHEFLFKLQRLQDLLHTPTAKAIAAGRHRFMTEFYDRLISEVDGEL